MDIELAEVADAEKILRLQQLCYQSEADIYHDYSIAPLRETLDQIRAEFERQVFLKATVNQALIGSVRAYTENETCFIGRLIVHPEHQNQGIGKKLMLSLEAIFMMTRRFELFTGHRSLKNLHLYQGLDYKEFKRQRISEELLLVYLEKLV